MDTRLGSGPRRVLYLTLSWISGFTAAAPTAQAGTIRAALVRDTYLIGEPVIIQVTVLEDGVDLGIVEGSRNTHFRAYRNLDAHLLHGDTVVAKAMLAGGSLDQSLARSNRATGTFMGVFGNVSANQGERATFRLWSTPGEYSVVVSPESRPDQCSTRLTISLRDSLPSEQPIIKLLESAGVDLPWALYGMPHTSDAIDAFEQIAANYRGTRFANYANAGLLLAKAAEPRSPGKDGSEASVSTVASDLLDVARLFESGHPLRNRALLLASSIDRLEGRFDRALVTLQTLVGETKDDWYRTTTEERLTETRKR